MILMKKVSTLLGTIIILIAVAVFFGGVFAYQYFMGGKAGYQSVNQNNGWQTYRNDQYGFELKIPPLWIAEEVSDPAFVYYVKFSGPDGAGEVDFFDVAVWTSTEPDLGKTVRNFYLKGVEVNTNYFELNGYPAANIHMLSDVGNGNTIMIKNGFVYRLPEIIPTTPAILRNAVLTFKFTK